MAAGACVSFDELRALLQAIFVRHGVEPAAAALLAANCAAAERDGAHSHGVFRIPGYVSTLASGYVDVRAVPRVERAAPAFLRVDAANGFAQPALEVVRPEAMEIARRNGVCAVAIRNSHHFGALWLDVEPFARDGLLAMAWVSGIRRVAPHGGTKPFYGTDPMAFAAPRAGADPLVWDQASASMSYGDLRLAAREGRRVPPGTGIDGNGASTTDPAAIVDGGAILPFGGHKGSSIAMMVELLAAALTGSDFSFQVDRSAYPGAETSRSGEFILLVDPACAGQRPFVARLEELVAGLHASGQQRLPGDRRYANRRRAAEQGVPLDPATLQSLRALAGH
jgi:delta1-piperideine-2-carboxylate reductase